MKTMITAVISRKIWAGQTLPDKPDASTSEYDQLPPGSDAYSLQLRDDDMTSIYDPSGWHKFRPLQTKTCGMTENSLKCQDTRR